MAESIKHFSPGEHERGFLLGGGVRSVKTVCLRLSLFYIKRGRVFLCVCTWMCAYINALLCTKQDWTAVVGYGKREEKKFWLFSHLQNFLR